MTPAATVQQYVDALFQLLPPGRYWRRSEDWTRLANMIAGLSPELARVHDRFLDLIREMDPRTTDDLLVNWYELVGFPDPCIPASLLPTTPDEWRAAIHQRVIATGGASAAYIEAVAEALVGPPCNVITGPYLPFRVSLNRCGDRLNESGSEYIWILQAPAATTTAQRTQLECWIDRIKPAHTRADYEYTL